LILNAMKVNLDLSAERDVITSVNLPMHFRAL